MRVQHNELWSVESSSKSAMTESSSKCCRCGIEDVTHLNYELLVKTLHLTQVCAELACPGLDVLSSVYLCKTEGIIILCFVL